MLQTAVKQEARAPKSIFEAFNSAFSVFEADTDELRLACQRLRYRIYCLERRFEAPQDNPGGIESDAWDAQSVHALVIHRPTGMAAGTLRLILPRLARDAPALPFLTYCDAVDIPPQRDLAEISRFGISRRFRQLVDDDNVTIDTLLLSLIHGCVRLAASHGIAYLCALLEPALIRRVARLDVYFPPAGPLVTHHGLRQPSIIRVDDVLSHLAARQPDAWAAVTRLGDLWRLPPGLSAIE